jgi:ATP-binding cassette subfamily C protein
MAIAVLDLVGVLLIGLVAYLSVSSGDNAPIPGALGERLSHLGLDPSVLSVPLIAIVAAAFLVMKSVLSGFLARKTMLFLASQQTNLSVSLASGFLRGSLIEVERRPSQQVAYAITTGVYYAITMVLSFAAVAAGELSLLVVLATALLVLDPLVSVFSLLYFGGVAVVLHVILKNLAAESGKSMQESAIFGFKTMQDAIVTFREAFVLDRREYFVNQVRTVVSSGSRGQAQNLFVGQVPRVAYEAALVVGAFLLSAWQVAAVGFDSAVATLAVFLAAGSRMMPSLLRLNGLLAAMTNAIEQARSTYEFCRESQNLLEKTPHRFSSDTMGNPVLSEPDFSPSIRFKDVSFRYIGQAQGAIICVNLEVVAGASLAIVGRTGSGKSTLADLLLGLIEPTSGTIEIGGKKPIRAVSTWPGRLAYVPQYVALVEGTVRENVALAMELETVDDSELWRVLRAVRLDGVLSLERQGLDTLVGDRGVRLSGGQRQRLGLARALLMSPRLLVLDEATSALDAETEVAISSAIADLRGEVTVVTVAHRLSTIQNADQVLYLDSGRALAQGTFAEVRAQVPGFDAQARIMGL